MKRIVLLSALALSGCASTLDRWKDFYEGKPTRAEREEIEKASSQRIEEASNRHNQRIEARRIAEEAAQRAIENRRTTHIKRTAGLSAQTKARIREGKVAVGMTAADARASWGAPERINKTIHAGGVREQWVYGFGSYLYIQNDRLASIQQSR